MLIQLKNKQRNIASVTLSLFLGSWLLLLCQTCMALVDDVNNLIDSVVELSDCHSTENVDATYEISTENENHCLGVCDCDELSVTTNSEKNHELKIKFKFSQDLYAFFNPSFYQTGYDLPDKLISIQPEQAILLPFKRYTVLLN
jgi:hypothetical protein